MNRTIAYHLLTAELSSYRNFSAGQLSRLVCEKTSEIKRGSDNIDYVVEILVTWANNEKTSIEVAGSVGLADWGAPHDRLQESLVVPIAHSKLQ